MKRIRQAILQMDRRVLTYFNERENRPCVQRIVRLITALGNGAFYGMLTASVFLFINPLRPYAYLLIAAIFLNALDVNLILKKIFRRERPYDARREIRIAIVKPTDYSFPSGHTSVTTAITIILIYLGTRMGGGGWIFIFANIGFLLLMAFSRLYLKVHYLSDVLAGVAAGLINGFAVLFFRREIISFCETILSF
ncbi:MAG: phosphatase PAP2 family protein [Eubacteriales bacterium]|nr:phosphatase PAP2 family protein [Eubacteriales bacterium]